MKASGNSTSFAPCLAASCVREVSFSMVRLRSKTTGEDCTTATLEGMEIPSGALTNGQGAETGTVCDEKCWRIISRDVDWDFQSTPSTRYRRRRSWTPLVPSAELTKQVQEWPRVLAAGSTAFCGRNSCRSCSK